MRNGRADKRKKEVYNVLIIRYKSYRKKAEYIFLNERRRHNILKDCKGNYKIYAHINKINGKIYIGQTQQKLKDRFGHNGSYYKHSSHFWNAIQKYGWDSFKHITLISGISLKLANILEEELIKKYNTMDNKIGYNMIAGGNNRKRRQEVTDRIAEKNRHPSPETLRKMSIASTGRKHSPEVIEKIRKSNTGKIRNEETRRKMSIAKQSMSKETKMKISEAGKGRKPSQQCIDLARERFMGNRFRAKRIMQYDLDGKCIRTWECAMDVEKELGINHGNIGKCCNGNVKSAGGYQWRYDNENLNNINPVKINDRRIKIYQYSLKGSYIKTWDSVFQINKELGYATSNINKCCRGKIYSAYGYRWSKDYKDNLDIYINPHCRRIVQFDTNMNYIKVWNSIMEASNELNLKYGNIQSCCERKSKQSKTGFLWRYIEDTDLKNVGGM